jgi:Mce-associated membrane protein
MADDAVTELDIADPATTPQTAEAVTDDHTVADATSTETGPLAMKSRSTAKLAVGAGLITVVALAGLDGYLGYRGVQSNNAVAQRNLFLEVARQGATNLTTINWQHADGDVKRILDIATGTFYDDFSKRSAPFVDVVKKAQSVTEGSVTAAGVESETRDQAQVLVAVNVKTANAGGSQQQPRAWRMRITVQRTGPETKVSNVEFVP